MTYCDIFHNNFYETIPESNLYVSTVAYVVNIYFVMSPFEISYTVYYLNNSLFCVVKSQHGLPVDRSAIIVVSVTSPMYVVSTNDWLDWRLVNIISVTAVTHNDLLKWFQVKVCKLFKHCCANVCVCEWDVYV